MTTILLRQLGLLLRALLLLCLLSPSLYAEPAPNFAFKTNDKTYQLSSFKGRVVYLDFWASWCVPCRKSFPWMNEMHKRYEQRGLTIIGVNLDQNAADAKVFLDKLPADFRVIYDPQGKLAEKYNIKAMPSSYLIDQQGNLVHTELGFKLNDKEMLEKKITTLLGIQQVGSP